MNGINHSINRRSITGDASGKKDWKYSSDIDYYGGKGVLEIIDLPTLAK